MGHRYHLFCFSSILSINGVFDAVTITSPETVSLSFMDDLGFLVSGNSVTSLVKTGEAVLKWGLSNAVTYDIAKTEAMLFSKARGKRVKKDIAAIRLVFGEQELKFNCSMIKLPGGLGYSMA